ncbi:acyl-CoA ligase (AMP-forming), exosortase A system-associated [candidate division KSB1 bacterium]|nr:acyl-CoA ligase (AMP-forming), exosortase A system-associated [candidate division KSB1 bacterium]RQW11784.1 MAG: acyl-CoA ligase (AMP-forming), exosortase A system-associated [candidate division KSB1 bacterium]
MVRVLHDILTESIAKGPDKQAVFFKEQSMTYDQVGANVRSLASYLIAHGLQKGDRVAFWMEKRFEEVISIFAISMSGAVNVPIRRLSTAAQVVHILNDSGAKVLLTTYSRMQELREHDHELESLALIICVGDMEVDQAASTSAIQQVAWSDILKNANGNESFHPRVVETDLAAILYTSGSTGKPKGVVLTHRNIVAGAYTVSEYLKITENDRLLSILPFNFDYGLNQLTTAVLHHASIVLLDPLFPKDVLQIIAKHKVTGLAAVAATWIQLLQIPWDAEKLASLRYMTNSGGAIPEHYVLDMADRLPHAEIYLMYGLTEAFRSTYLDPALVRERPTSMGKAIPGEEIVILDENNKPVQPGQIGELVHRGALVAQGYWGDVENTSIRFRPNPMQPADVPLREIVVFSGDYVKIDEQGFLYFIGRKDEMIKYAGNRVSPTEVEEVLYKHPKVKDSMVLGIPDDVYGQSIKAVVAHKDGSLSREELISHCKAMLPPYMIPGDVEIWDELPRNSNGKIDRAQIRKTVYANLGIEKNTTHL